MICFLPYFGRRGRGEGFSEMRNLRLPSHDSTTMHGRVFYGFRYCRIFPFFRGVGGGGRGIGGSCGELLYFIKLELLHRNEQGFAAVLFSNKFPFGFFLYIAGARLPTVLRNLWESWARIWGVQESIRSLAESIPGLLKRALCAGIFKQSIGARNRVVVPARQARQPGGIGFLESILGLLKV